RTHSGAEDIAKVIFQFAIAVLLEQVHFLETFQVAPQLFQPLPGLVALFLQLSLGCVDLALVLQAQAISFALALSLSGFHLAPRLLRDSITRCLGYTLKSIKMPGCNCIALLDDNLVGRLEKDFVFGSFPHRCTQFGQGLALGLACSFEFLLAALFNFLPINGREALFCLANGAISLTAQIVDTLDDLLVQILLK